MRHQVTPTLTLQITTILSACSQKSMSRERRLKETGKKRQRTPKDTNKTSDFSYRNRESYQTVKRRSSVIYPSPTVSKTKTMSHPFRRSNTFRETSLRNSKSPPIRHAAPAAAHVQVVGCQSRLCVRHGVRPQLLLDDVCQVYSKAKFSIPSLSSCEWSPAPSISLRVCCQRWRRGGAYTSNARCDRRQGS